ncbi:MAG TPA: hypothetical protein VF121_02280 [Thermoanaerobaculia bacterium]|nr:hypothetical protein [Thermoanaerobaculia bacterium]
MQVLTETEELLLAVFHEKRRDRVGATPGQTVAARQLLDVGERFPPDDVEVALAALVDRKLVVPEGEGEGQGYAITQQGVDYLYSGAGVGAFSRADNEGEVE